MSFISYAQNYEDVMLRRALKNIDKGFYVDVGANDPIVDSVTKAFYDAGWRGINVEPVREWFNKYEEKRPEDINLQLAVGEHEGKADFYEVVGTGLSTMNESIAKRHAKEHNFEIKSYKVPVTRLAIICEKYAEADIHFLKIDVEGAEASVLKSLDLKKVRPWIILVESTQPGTQIQSYKDWEPILLVAEYEFVYFDGLNRFYVAKEHSEIKPSLAISPNVFDDYLVSGTGSSQHHVYVRELQYSIIEAQSKAEEQEQILKEALLHAQQQNNEIEKQAQDLKEQVSQKDEKLRDNADKQQELMLSLLEKKTKQQETAARLRASSQQIEKLEESFKQSEEQEQILKEALLHAQQQNNEIEKQAQDLKEQVSQKDEKLSERENAISWLNNEWEASKQKVDELHQSNHQWWSMSDQHSKALQAIYSSTSWNITWPLRKLSQFMQWLFGYPIQFTIWFVRVPKRIVRWLYVKGLAFVLSRPLLSMKFSVWLKRCPWIYNKTRQLALSSGILLNQMSTPRAVQVEDKKYERQPEQEHSDSYENAEQIRETQQAKHEQDDSYSKLAKLATHWNLGKRMDG